MRKFYIFALVATMFAACATDGINEPSAVIGDLAPETLTVSFEGEESRIQLQEGKTVWNEGDLVSVFYRSNANQKWQFQGATGDRTGNLKCVEMGTATETMNRVVAVYPYAENYYINPETYNIEASLPAQQTYIADSYGVGGNIMVSSGEYNQVVLRSVCGWLKLELTGNGEKISTITLKGNNGEQVAGQLYINSADATATLASEMGGAEGNGSASGNLVFEDTILKEVTLNCGDGVELSAEPTAFYIALPPQTFEKGLTAVFTSENGVAFEKSTDKAVVIERNTIQPMASIEVPVEEAKPANNEIWYTNGSSTQATTPSKTDVFGANIVSNTYDTEKECWVIKFDGNVASIGNNAFSHCTRLISVTIPDSVTTIGDYAFHSCSNLKSITIPDSVTAIEWSAFYGCRSLTSITIPDSVTKIGPGAFCGCSSLTSITIPDSVTAINGSVFEDCSRLTSITIPDSVTGIGQYAFYNCSSLTSVTIGDSVTSIGIYAFSGCSSLASVTIGNSVTTIGNYTFYNCSSLTSVTIPSGVTKIGLYAFQYCSSLTSVIIPDSVTEIGRDAFRDCRSLKSATIPDSVTTIESNTFNYCSSLTSVTISDSVTSIGDGAFCNCGSLTSVTIPDSVTTIGIVAFSDCSSLTSVTIPNSVTTIGSQAFKYCRSLTSVYCKATTPPTAVVSWEYSYWDAFGYNDSDRKIYVPAASVDAYKSAEYWSNYADAIEMYPYIPSECTSLTITADDVRGNDTTTTIYYTAVTYGVDGWGVSKSETITGTAISDEFPQNTSTTESIERMVSFTYLGQTATTTITQGPFIDKGYTINLNSQWRLSSSVSNPDASLYDGVYESNSNYNVDSGVATMYIDITGYTEFSFYVRSYAESNYDYVMVSQLDKTITGSTSYSDTTLVKAHTRGNQKSGSSISDYTKVTYSNISSGTHRITIVYRKDSSQHSGADRGYVIIPKNQ